MKFFDFVNFCLCIESENIKHNVRSFPSKMFGTLILDIGRLKVKHTSPIEVDLKKFANV